MILSLLRIVYILAIHFQLICVAHRPGVLAGMIREAENWLLDSWRPCCEMLFKSLCRELWGYRMAWLHNSTPRVERTWRLESLSNHKGATTLHWMLYFFILFFGHACGMQKFPNQGLNPSHLSENTESLTPRPPGNSLQSFIFWDYAETFFWSSEPEVGGDVWRVFYRQSPSSCELGCEKYYNFTFIKF